MNHYSLEPGRYLIEASAGTGKTYTITRLFLEMIRDRGVAPSQILVTTFSKSAAAELKERLQMVLDDELRRLSAPPQMEDMIAAAEWETRRLRVQLAVSSFDEILISTIHGFCQRMLRDFALEAGVSSNIRLTNTDTEICDRLLRQCWRLRWRKMVKAGLSLDKLRQNLLSIPLDVQVEYADNKESFGWYARCLRYLQWRLPGEKQRQEMMSFDDLINRMRDALLTKYTGPRLARAIGSRFKVVFIDEFQDTSREQFEIFDRCFPAAPASHTVYLIGDPKQSIYAFRNANIYTYLRAKKSLPPEHVYTMTENYRSSPAMIRAVNYLFSGHASLPAGTETPNAMLQDGIPFVSIAPGRDPRKYDKLLIGGSPVQAPIRFRQVCPDDELRMAADDVKQLLNSGMCLRSPAGTMQDLTASDIAVLLPKNQQVEDMVGLLRERGINAVSVRTRRVFDSPEAASLEMLLHLWREPADNLLRDFLLSPLLTMPAAKVDALANNAAAEPLLDAWRLLGRDCAERWESGGLAAALTAWLDAPLPGSGHSIREHILRQERGERRLTNFLHLQEILHQQAMAERLMPDEVLQVFRQAIAGRSMRGDASTDDDDNPFATRIDSSRAAVKCLTMHHAKGMEFPVVFLPFIASGKAGKSSRSPYAVLTADAGERICRFYDSKDSSSFGRDFLWEDLRGQMRLLYVSLTRAKYLQYLYLRDTSFETSRKRGVSAEDVLRLAPDPGMSAEQRMMHVLSAGGGHAAWLATGKAGLIEKLTPETQFPVDTQKIVPPSAAGMPELTAAPMPEKIDHAWRIMSYSGFPFAHPAAPPLTEDAPDAPFMAFPRGARVGDLFHGVMEKLTPAAGASLTFADLQKMPPGLNKMLETQLKNNGFAVDLLPDLLDGLRRAVTVPLTGWGKPLTAIGAGRAMAELEFELAVPQCFTLQQVLTVLQAFPPLDDPALWPEYQSPTEPLTGLLTGFIDLIFEDDGRYYIVDWKTNDLGPHWLDYSPDAVQAAMGRNGYLLQAHFYAAALCLSLRQRLGDDFCYERDFGGVCYLFPRGMDAAHPGNGIWFGKPDGDCIRQLLTLFQGGAAL